MASLGRFLANGIHFDLKRRFVDFRGVAIRTNGKTAVPITRIYNVTVSINDTVTLTPIYTTEASTVDTGVTAARSAEGVYDLTWDAKPVGTPHVHVMGITLFSVDQFALEFDADLAAFRSVNATDGAALDMVDGLEFQLMMQFFAAV